MDFIAARDLDEALDAKSERPSAEFLAGGTDLMVEVNLAHHRPDAVVSLRRVDALRESPEGDATIEAGTRAKVRALCANYPIY